MNAIINKNKLKIISQTYTLLSPIPIAIRTIIIMGDVKGISLNQNESEDEGSSITLPAIIKANTIGMVSGNKNC